MPYFGTTAYLAQSPQLYKQMAQAAGLGKVFEIAPAFRADPSFTARHSTGDTSVDMELSWIDSHEDVMRVHEQLMEAAISAVVARHGGEIEELLGKSLRVPSTPFPRVTLAEAREMIARDGYVVPRSDGDLDPEGERRLCQIIGSETGSEFVFVTDYESKIRPLIICATIKTQTAQDHMTSSIEARNSNRSAERASPGHTRDSGSAEGPLNGRLIRVLQIFLIQSASARRFRHGSGSIHDATSGPAEHKEGQFSIPWSVPPGALNLPRFDRDLPRQTPMGKRCSRLPGCLFDWS